MMPMAGHWLLKQAVELPAAAVLRRSGTFATKTDAAPGDDDDVDNSLEFATKTMAAPGDDDDVDGRSEVLGLLTKHRRSGPDDEPDAALVSYMTKTKAAPGDDDDLDS
jgi:hypothetical protein